MHLYPDIGACTLSARKCVENIHTRVYIQENVLKTYIQEGN